MPRFPHRLLLPAAVAALLLTLALAATGAGAFPSADPAAGVPDEATLVTAAVPPAEAPEAGRFAAVGPGYLSPVTAAPRPFTHMLLRWEATMPASATVRLEVRASLDGATWSDWGAVLENDDMWAPEDGPEVFWGQEIYAGEGARFWQVRAILAPGPDGLAPELRRVSVNTVDARYGPADPAPAATGGPDSMIAGLTRPPVVSRSGWGSPDGQGSRATPAYRAAGHMVVHHTADSNSLAAGQRWADRVRAIWSFHTITRGWGDIGYNYLIDPNGVIYEGRAGGDDAVGFHDTANYGSMGVAVIGTYASAAPSASAQSSLVELLAWKADQKDINPLGSARYYGCSISQYCSPFNPGSVVATIAGHRDVTPGRTTCPGDALESLLPQIRERVRDRLAGGSGDDPAAARIELLGVAYDRTSVPAGELLKVTFTVRNSGAAALEGQAPEAGRDPVTGAYSLADSYAYDEGECFLGAEGQSYPAYPKELGRLRLTLGPAEEGRQPACAGSTGGYPWRWGINGRLEPGEVREVVGYIRLRTPGTVTLRAGAINEYVGYLADGVGGQTITVTPERQMPAPAAFDEALRPLAHVYALGAVPDNLVARATDGTAVLRGAHAGSFTWHGETRDWGEGGPLAGGAGPADRFVVEQTRAFVAPVAGEYTFQVTADDGGWLWVDGRQVVGGERLPDASTLTGAVRLEAGPHVLAFRGVERAGGSTMGYAVRLPGGEAFSGLPDDPVERLGATFRAFPGMALAADDMGGVGVAAVRLSLNGGPWEETPGPIAQVGPLADGAHTVRYLAVDGAGNMSEERALSLRVDSSLSLTRVFLPTVTR